MQRNFLLLQGLVGPFFHRIGERLRADGYGVQKINFNGGDRLFWPGPGGIDFTGRTAEFPAFLDHVMAQAGTTDVLLFGDCRPLHRAAIALCRQLHVAVHVFDEGYIRPDWVTLELGGVNGHSELPRDPDWYLAHAAMLPPAPVHNKVPASFARRAREAVAYDLANLTLRWRFPHWDNHRPFPPLVEAKGWVKRLRSRQQAAARSAATMAALAGRQVFLLPLQLDSDAQIRCHSPYNGMAAPLAEVIASFAAHAPADVQLLVKEHPLDNGVRDWRGMVAAMAASHHVSERLRYLECGDIALVLERVQGVVTVNSTTGTLALANGLPVICLGQAVYDVPRITHQDGLDAFWSRPMAPDSAVFAAFRRVLIERCLVAGGFFSEPALALLVDNAVARLEAHCPRTFAERSRGRAVSPYGALVAA